jgi:HAD superfamily hydrolase (TIGR01509 family)
MIKLIAFDLDGVLVSTKDIHFHALNEALKEQGAQYVISEKEHLSVFDGLKTTEKLNMLSEKRGLPRGAHDSIWKRKQEFTAEVINRSVGVNHILVDLMRSLTARGVKIACCSNSIRSTTALVLERLGIKEYFDIIVSNEDVKNSKPHPEMYWKVMSLYGVLPEETLILEDSPVGLRAATLSGANTLRISDPLEVTKEFVESRIGGYNGKMNSSWSQSSLNVVIPMAGAGSRFESAGYTFPKPLISVRGKPMIQVVVENLGIQDATFIYIVRSEHRQKYNLDTMLQLITPGQVKIVETDGLTEGAAVTTLLASEFIDNESPLLLANSDQYVEWSPSDFFYFMQESATDGGIVTFKSTHPKWSFAKVGEDGYVERVAEKNPISHNATVGIYYWKRGSDYVASAKQMIDKNIRTNNEFYVCPAFNEGIQGGLKFKTFDVDDMHGLGTPEDLEEFLKEDRW